MNDVPPDRDLLREFSKQRSESAFQTLVQRHADLVFATAMRWVGEAAAAQEVMQDVFIALANRATWPCGEGVRLPRPQTVLKISAYSRRQSRLNLVSANLPRYS